MERRKRSRFKHEARRRLAFRDRQTALTTVLGHLAASRGDATYMRVIVLVGLGGIGKSRLLDEITLRALEIDPELKTVRVSLESESVGTAVAPLKAIRDRLDFDCLLFDCAILTYWVAMGQPFRLVEGGALSRSVVVKAVEAGVGLTGLSLPLAFAGDMFERTKRRMRRRRLYDKAEFEEIDQLRDSPTEILERMPFYLGQDIDRHLADRLQATAFLYDSYEKQSRSSLDARSDWLREFIGTLDRGIHIIASRESLQWPDRTWDDVLTEIVVDALPEHDCRDILRHETGAPPEAVDRMVHVSRCIPFFVEACIDAYLALKGEADPVDIFALPDTQDEATSLLIRHLASAERELIIALATLQFFDALHFQLLVRALNIPLPFSAFDDVRSLYFVEAHNAADGVYKTHDILSDFVRSEPSLKGNRIAATEAASQMLALRTDTAECPDRILPIFFGLLQACSNGDAVSTQTIETIVDVGYRLYDIGLWRELASIGDDGNFHRNESGELVARFFKSLSLRRLESIPNALNMLGELRADKARLGKHAFSIDFEIAYLREISGQYAEAREIFSSLYMQCKPFDPTNRTHARSLLYHADMLIMDGSLEKGADLLLEGCELLEPEDRFNLAEFVRHRAHAFRYSFLLDEATSLYLQALSKVPDVPSLRGKLTGNLAECQCWANPALAIENARLALELNEKLRNLIEVGKNHKSLSLAYSMLGMHEAAETHYQQARNAAAQVGYRAGGLFAEVAGCIAAVGTEAVFQERFIKLQSMVQALGTYRHQLLLPVVLVGGADMAGSLANECAWIEPSTIIERAAKIAAQLRSGHPMFAGRLRP